MKKYLILILITDSWLGCLGQKSSSFNGLDLNLGNLFRVSDAKTRSISPENLSGEPGKGGMTPIEKGTAGHDSRELGLGWKVNPYVFIEPGQTFTMAEISGPGAIQHIWLTPTGNWRFSILRIYWDDEPNPSVETPVGDFFGMGWGNYFPLNSIPVAVNPGSAFNCYWVMPFRKKCRITMQNMDAVRVTLYYQIDYTITEVPADAGYFHAEFRRMNPTRNGIYTIADSISGKGQYIGTYLAVGTGSYDWWGEGEIKFYMDGDGRFPTIIGTGTEDYFCGSYNFEVNERYQTFSAAYSGFHEFAKPDGLFNSRLRFGMYRWHVMDPVRFENSLRVTLQDLGWKNNRYTIMHSDISSVAFWYQIEPHHAFPKLPSAGELEYSK